jgi:pyroglutamyl-peptidase
MAETALVTGFEPYGGRSLNPSGRVAATLDGTCLAGVEVVGRRLPVIFAGLAERIAALLDELRPAFVVALGLWPGESVLRLERFAVNLADFAIADNAGARLDDAVVVAGGQTALAATLPLRAIETALLDDGIPVRLSNSAGNYLCNATLYTLLDQLERRGRRVPCGFIHLPYLTEQVAQMLSEARAGHRDLQQVADLPSMDFATMERAIRLALAVVARSI